MSSVLRERPSAKSVCALGRGVSLTPPDGEGYPGFLGCLRIRVGDVADLYCLEKIPSDFGDAFRVQKRVGHEEEHSPAYHVCLDDAGSTCECKGFLRWGHCKHVESLVALREAGRI